MADARPHPDVASPAERTLAPDTTIDLLRRVQLGDDHARNQLLERLLPPLRRWASGRLSGALRGAHETGDLVQETALKVLPKLDGFEIRHQGALQAYFRRAMTNRIVELARANKRHPSVEVPEDLADEAASPLARAIGQQNVQRFEGAFAQLSDGDQQAIHLRFELDYSYDELAIALDKASPDAARMAVKRAVHRLAGLMARGERRDG